MSKAIISNRVYLEVDSELRNNICQKLSYSIPTYGGGPALTINNYSTIRQGLMSLPVGRQDFIPDNYEIIDKRVLVPADIPQPSFNLRPSQQAILNELDDNCLINAKVGWGKSIMALAAAHKLGQKTLIVVHTLQLMKQWVNEVKQHFGFQPDVIGGGNISWGTPIVIGNVASLYKRMGELGKAFGTVIFDEVHHVPSNTFSKIVDCSYARYKIGLSGTLVRKDMLHVLLKDYFGHKVFMPEKENTVDPEIHVIDTGLSFPSGSVWANRVTELSESFLYRQLVVKLAKEYEQKGYQVLIVSDRTAFLKHVAGQLGSALVIGDTKDREQQLALLDTGQAKSLCGTLSIWKEGLSKNSLSCLILATPINNDPMLEQLIGRIQRLNDDKLSPVVVDLVLRGYSTEKQFKARQTFYNRQGFKIQYR